MKIATTTAGIRQQVADSLDAMVHRAMREAREAGGKCADDYTMTLRELLAKSKKAQKLMRVYTVLSNRG